MWPMSVDFHRNRPICPQIVDVWEGEGTATAGKEESQRATIVQEEMNGRHTNPVTGEEKMRDDKK